MFPTPYFLPEHSANMLDTVATLILFSLGPLILDQGIMKDPKGLTIITKEPIPEGKQRILGLIPFENL